jgi:hypothetical protein
MHMGYIEGQTGSMLCRSEAFVRLIRLIARGMDGLTKFSCAGCMALLGRCICLRDQHELMTM